MQDAMRKRGQAALEFMMTYGWAILVVIVAISALSYYGVLRADKFLPDSCSITPGIICLSFKATPDSLEMVVQNQLGQDITLTEVAVTSCAVTEQIALANGAKTTLSFSSCEFGEEGKKLKTAIDFTYTDEEGIHHTKKGEIITKVE